MATDERKGVGPIKTIGLVLSTIGTAANVVDDTVRTSGEVLHHGLSGINVVTSAGAEALEIVTTGALEDLKTDQIVESAHRKVRAATALAEAEIILSKLSKD